MKTDKILKSTTNIIKKAEAKIFSVAAGTLLIATPMKNTADKIDAYIKQIKSFDYPKENTSLAFLVSDSTVNIIHDE